MTRLSLLPLATRLPAARVLAALLVFGLALGVSGCDDEAAPVAWLVEFTGPVRIDRAADGKGAEGGSKDAPLYDGNVVSTGPAAKATVRFSDRTQVTVGENTRFKVGGVGGKSGAEAKLTLELEQGSILSNSRQAGAGALTIVTRFGRTQVLEGSEIQFTLGEGGQGSMDVLFGQIELVTGDGKKVSVLEGEAMDLALGAKTTSAAAAGAVDGGAAADAGVIAEAPAEALPLQLMFAAARGKPLVKAAGAKTFATAGSEAQPVPEGSEFKIPKGALALLSGKGLVSRLGAGATGSVGKALLQGDAEQYGLGLETGGAELEFTNRAARVVKVNSRGREILMESKDLGGIALVVGKSGVDFTVRAGEVKLTSGEGSVTLHTGEQVSLAAGAFKGTRKLQPAIVLPHSRRVRVYADRLEEVGLMLPQSEQPLRVEVARDAEFNDRILSGLVNTALVTVPAPASGELFWRALGENDDEVAKGRARFTPDKGRSAVDLDHPHAEVAETGLKASVLFQGEPPSLSFSFAPKDGAASYRVRVYKAADLKKPVTEKVVKETRATFEAGQLGEGQYLWNAAPLDAAGGELSGGRMNKLELIYDNSRTSLSISRPRSGEAPGPKGTLAEGIAPIGSKLFVNGKAAPLDSKGRFSVQVPRSDRSDKIVFRLVENGSEGFWVRQLRGGRRSQ